MGSTRSRPARKDLAAQGLSTPVLDRYRGIAVALIVVYTVYQHMRVGPLARYPYEGTPWHPFVMSLDAAVGYLFLASALLLGLPHARAALNGTTASPGQSVLFRRAVRLLPLYAVAVLVVWTTRNRSFPGDWRDLLEHLTFTQVFDDKRIFFTIGPAWAIAVEVQFCLLFLLAAPPLYARCSRLVSRRRRLVVLVAGAVGLIVASLTWKLAAYFVFDVDESRWSTWFGLAAKLDIFAVGLLLAVGVAAWESNSPSERPSRAKLAGVGVAVLVVGVMSRAWVSVPSYVFFHTVMAIGVALLLSASYLRASAGPAPTPSRNPVRRAGASVGVTLGLVCYSLYLWHEPVMLLLAEHGLFPDPGSPHSFVLGIVVLAPVAGVVAWLSYWIIEYPTSMIRRTRERGGTARRYYDER